MRSFRVWVVNKGNVMMTKIKSYFEGEAGIRALLKISLPMIVSQASSSLMLFTDRYLLAPLGKEYPSASMTGGFSSVLLAIFFMGLLGYINPLVSQYLGAGKKHFGVRILSQGIFVVLIVFPFILALGHLGIEPYFDWADIPRDQKILALQYFNIVNFGNVFMLLNTVLSSFFTGIGYSRLVMICNIFGLLLNIPLNLYLIKNGVGGVFSGIEGAALATLLSYGAMSVLYLCFLCSRNIRDEYGLKEFSLRPDREVLGKILKFGGPTGGEFFLLFFAFNTFVTLFHSYGADEALAMTIAFNWDIVALLPLWGLNIGIMSMVGKFMGAGKVDLAVMATMSGARIAMILTAMTMSCFLFFTEPMVRIFLPELSPEALPEVTSLAVTMLRMIAFYCMATAVNMVLTATLRAAGDTRWCMLISLLANWSMLIFAWISIKVLHWSPELTWYIFVGTVVLESLVFLARYLSGHWKQIRVI